jgi:hypothetical protein
VAEAGQIVHPVQLVTICKLDSVKGTEKASIEKINPRKLTLESGEDAI